MDLETVNYSAEGGVARVVLNRPDKRNALNHQLLDDIDAAFEAAERDDSVRVVVLSGAGPSFCAATTSPAATTPPRRATTAAGRSAPPR